MSPAAEKNLRKEDAWSYEESKTGVKNDFDQEE